MNKLIAFLILIVTFYIILIIMGCDNNRTKEKTKIENSIDITQKSFIELNNTVNELIQLSLRYPKNSKEQDSLFNTALKYVDFVLKNADSNIQTDSNFYLFYTNKSIILKSLGMYKESLNPLLDALKITDDPSIIFFIGLTYDKLGNHILATKKYREAYQAYANYKVPMITKWHVDQNLKYIRLLLGEKQKMIEEIDKKLKKEPNNTILLLEKNSIEEFNLVEFLKRL